MLAFIKENIANIVVAALVGAAFVAALAAIYRAKKKALKSGGCGCGCSGCTERCAHNRH